MNVALLGCGAVTYHCHLPALKRIAGVSVVAAADPDPEALVRIAGAARLALHEHPEDVLARGDVDAVIIAVPTHLHAATAVAAADAGKHFYLEKPVATDAPGAARVAEAAQRAAVVAAVGFNRRLHPLYEQARALVRAGRLGRVRLGQSAHCEPAPGAGPGLSPWRRARATGGGVLLDLASHHVDLLRWLLDDEPAEVSATLGSEFSEHDSASVQLVTRGGVVVQSAFSFRAGFADYLELIGERGSLRVDRHQAALTLRVARRFGYGTRRAWVAPSRAAIHARVRRLSHPAEDPSYHRALSAFVQRVRTGTGPTASIGDGVRSLDVVLAAEESARLGASVSLPTR